MVDEKLLIEILDSKERRANKQSILIDKYKKSLISFTLNIPGRVKDNKVYRDIHIEGMKVIEDYLKSANIEIVYKEEGEHSTGREGYIVADKDGNALKLLTIDIEETHPLGRIFDIDIFNKQNEQISRSDLENTGRKCLLCDNDARVCMRMKTHTYEELIQSIDDIWLEYIRKK